ncbi:MAG TPA: UDP-N-acetylmuramate dehydrogenase [Candidatus Paceibacterota bacterium]
MKIFENYDLTKLNTFGISARARFFVEINTEDDIKELFTTLEFKENEKLFLGGGSNILLTKDFEGIVILNKIRGIEILEEDAESVLIKSLSGEVWHDLVLFTVNRGYWGIENLSLIPGTVGGALVENLGAYGAQLSDVLDCVEAIEIESGARRVFKPEECGFSYHDSIFKNELKGKYFILSLILRLGKTEKKNIKYRAFAEYSEEKKLKLNNSKDISDAVVFIRSTKLPDPRVIGNAGSFFRNVYVEGSKLEELLASYPSMPHYIEGGVMKVPAGWLVEQAGWKGKRVCNTGVHEKHALVLVNHGGANGEEIKNLAKEISDSVLQKFGLQLNLEVNFI